MKKASLISMVLIFLFVSLCGCGKNTDSPTDIKDTTKEVISTVKPEEPTDSDYEYAELPVEGELNVYRISRKVFFDFIESPSIEILNTKNSGVHSYPSEGEKIYETSGVFRIEQSVVDFVDVESIQRYLSDNGYDVTVESVSVFKNESLPVCIWIITTKEDFAITINEKLDDYYSDEPYVYRLYTQAEFVDKFSRIEGKAVINGKSLPDDAIVYIYHNYAEVPLLASLECYGAEIISNDGDIAELKLNGETYYLDLVSRNFYRDGEERDNLFHQVDGGVSYYYVLGNDMMVDDIVFRYIIEDITGVFPKVHIDRNTKIVEITNNY